MKTKKTKKTNTKKTTKTNETKQKKPKLEHYWKANVLGTTYEIYVDDDPTYLDSLKAEGVTLELAKEIRIRNNFKNPELSIEEAEIDMKRVLRHELIHAFLYECGFTENTSEECSWSTSESMVDFWSLQFYKIGKIFEDSYIIVKELKKRAIAERKKLKKAGLTITA